MYLKRIYRKLEGPSTKNFFLREEKQYLFCGTQKMTGDLMDVFTFISQMDLEL